MHDAAGPQRVEPMDRDLCRRGLAVRDRVGNGGIEDTDPPAQRNELLADDPGDGPRVVGVLEPIDNGTHRR